MKLQSVMWVLRWRLVQPVVNLAVSVSQRVFWLVGYPAYKLAHTVCWIVRWRVIRRLTDLARYMFWRLRWEVAYPIVKKLHGAFWILRWRVARRVADAVRSLLWELRWRVVHPVVKILYSARWIFLWRILKPISNYIQYGFWYVRWRVVYPLLKSVVPTAILRVLYPVRARGLVRFIKDLRIKSIALISFGQYYARGQLPVVTLIGPQAVRSPQPAMFPAEDSAFLGGSSYDYEFPAVNISVIPDAVVFGRSNMVSAGGALLHHDLYQFTHDYTSEELHGKLRILPKAALVKQYEMLSPQTHYRQAALFMDSCSSNYAHWLTEVLPRINAFYNSLGESSHRAGNRALPLLLDAGLHINIQSSLTAIVGGAAQLVWVPNGTQIRVGELTVTSPTGYVPFDRRSSNLSDYNQGKFSPRALAALREQLTTALPPSKHPTPKKVFLRRNSKARSMVNADAIEARLVDEGFDAVSTELLSFAEQFHLFSGAEVVVGATGAAFANLIFCKPTTKIVICIAKFEDTSYGYWQNLACASGNEVTYVLGKISTTMIKTIHSDFWVDEAAVMQAVSG